HLFIRLRFEMKLNRLSIVLATWCPHCVPLSLEETKRLAEALKVPYRVLDIDEPDAVTIADQLVSKYGDNSEDYLVPQMFAEFTDGSVKHIFTGFSENTEVTKRHWEDLFNSRLYGQLKSPA
ncbi:MAG: glutaredoxin family protein, partial [Nitrososphaerales archaeon]